MLPTLDEFLVNSQRNSYVKHHINRVVYTIYLRKGQRYIDGRLYHKVLDIGNITASRKGTGSFAVLHKHIMSSLWAHDFDGIYVESVLNDQFANHLLGLGYTQVNRHFQTVNLFRGVWVG